MSRSLGINVKVDFGEAMRQLDAFEKRWEKLGKEPLKLKVKVDDSKIESLEKTVKRLNSLDNKGINLNVKTDKAMSNLRELKSRFESVKNEIEKGMDINFGSNRANYKGMDSAAKNSQSLMSGLQSADKSSKMIVQSYKEAGGLASRFVRLNSQGLNDVKTGYKSMADTRVSSAKKSVQIAKEEKASLRDIARLTKEIGKLNEKSIGKSGEEKDVIGRRIKERTDDLETLSKAHKKAFGKSAEDDWTVKGAQDLAKYNIELKQAVVNAKALKKSESGKGTSSLKEQKAAYSDLRKSISRTYQLKEKLENAGSNEAKSIQDAIAAEGRREAAIRRSISAKQLYNKEVDREISQSEELQSERRQENRAINQGSKMDGSSRNKRGYSGVFTDVLDPTRYYHEGKQAAMMMYDSVATLDEQMTNIEKVADVPSETLARFSKDIFKQASAVSKSADEYAVSVERWLTSGKGFEESQRLAAVSSVGGFVGNIGEEDMVRYMSVPLNSFKNEALEAEDIINSMNEVSNNNAIEMTELGKAYERASQTASNAGTSFSELTGMISGAQESTRAGGEKIGTALKAIDINFGAMMAGATKESVKRKDFFKGIGVEIEDGNGKLRSTYDIVGDLANKWDTLSDEQRNLATTYAAGKNHAAILQSLVTGWDDVTKATAEAQGQMGLMEDGSAYHEFEKQQQSVKAKAVELKNSWTELLVTIAGGREGVNGVLDILKDIVDAGVRFANNDFAMKIAGGFAKIVAASAGLVGINKLFGMISAGAKDAALFTGRLATSTGRMMKYTNKKGRAQLRQERNNQNVALIKEGKQPKVGFAKSFKGAKGISKAGVLIGGLSRGIGSLVPIIGGVTMALSVLDAMGLDVWGGMGKMVDKVAKKFEGAEKKAKKVNNEFAKTQNEHKKEISENKFLNGAVERNAKEIKSYKDLVSAKKKAYDAGETNSLSFSTEEFSHLKSQAEKLSKELGINVELEMNDYDHIISQFKKIEDYQNKISQKDMEKGVKKIGEVSEKKDMKDSLKAWEDKKDEAQRQLKNLEDTAPYMRNEIKKFGMTKQAEKDLAELEGAISEAKAAKADLENYFNTQYTKEEKKADASKRKNVNELRKDHGSQLESGNLNFSGMEKTEVDNGMTTMVSYTKKVQEEGNAIKKARDDIQQAYDKWNGVNGQTQDKNARVSKETYEQMKKLFPDKEFNTNVDSWGEGFDKTAIDEFNAATKESQQRTDNLRSKLQELAVSGQVGEEQFNKMTEALNGTNEEFVSFMMEQGEVGTSMLGISDTLMATRSDWKELVLDMQSQLEGVDMEKAIKLKIATEDGIVNGEMIDNILGIPEEIQSEFSIINKEGDVDIQKTMDALTKLEESEFSAAFKIEGGGIDFDKLSEYWGSLDEIKKAEFLASFEIEGKEEAEKAKEVADSLEDKKAKIEVKGEVKNLEELKKSQEVVNDIDGETATVTVTANDESHEVVVDAKGNVLSVDGLKATAILDADGNVSYKVINAKGEVMSLSSVKGLGQLDANGDPVGVEVGLATSSVEGMNKVTGEATIDGDRSPLQGKIDGIPSIPVPSVRVLLTGVMDGLLSGFFGGGKSGSATVNVKGKKGKSVGILDRNMAKSFSQSVSSAVGVNQSKPTKGKSSSKSSTDNKPVNSDVWRYWGKELFKGLPLERSMENLENAIKKAGENYDKLIPLYKQQISLMNQQIAFQKSMQKETQSELNEVLGKLRGKGFKTKGNQITNLDRAKSFKGESASDVEELLNKWKTLYEGLDDITGKINSLNQQKWDAEQSIKDAQIGKEAKALEDRLKKTTALLTAIESHMSILSKKEGLVSDSDYELKLTVQEESANDAKRNIGMLVDEFNKLSATTIKYGENADTVKSELESLKSEILNNADAILDYRESMNQLRIERLVQDYDKFNETISRNTSLLEGNVEALKEGLVSGTKISDLESSKLQNLMFDRKSALDKQYEDRLQIESKIDAALEAFSKKNVDRAKGVANAQLQIEKKKYEELLRMEKEYSNGKTPSYKEIGKFDLGTMVEQTSNSDKGYKEWLENMKKINNQYVSDFATMREEFEKSMDKAGTQAEKDRLTNKFIIDQLKLQEKIQGDIVKANNEAIALAEKELENATLTTEQRQELEEAILEYRDSSVDAQKEIRDLIEDRFEFEFDLLDKAAEKATKYSETLEHLLDVSNLAGRSSKDKQALIDKIYESKANEYYNAKKALQSLQEQQSKFVEGSFEWNLLQEKIEDVDKSLKDLTVSLLEANKKVLENRVEAIEDTFTKGVLDGKTLDQWRNFRDRWATGIEKEIELEKIRQRLLAMESDVNKERLEVLDRQEAVSKKELEYLDKQTKVLELQDKINNLDKERDVQTLVKKEDGTWDWEYQADQTEIDKAKEDLANAEKDLEAFKQEQREKYASDIQKVLDDAKNGKFESTDDLRKELEDVRNAYGEILSGIPNINEGSMEEILAAYDDFLKENGLIIDDALNGGNDTGFDDKLNKIGGMFESSFRAIAEDLGKVISDALSSALGLVTGVKRVNGEQQYVIQNQELVFPSVTDTTGFEEVLLDLPQTAQQKINSK